MITRRLTPAAVAGLAAVALLPLLVRLLFPESEKYYLHLMVQILLWAFIYTGWSLMGRFGLTSLGHGAFTGIGAYATVLLWNYAGITPWIGVPVAVAAAAVVGVLVGYPCFHLRITGHYFALLTLALTELVRLTIIGLRDYTGGSLGTQPARYGDGLSLYAMQFETDRMLAYYIAFALWLFGLYVWLRVDASMDRYALDAASQDEDAAASVGINVTREKLKITALSAALCALGGAVFGQYQMYIGPETIAGLGLSLNIVFAVIAGGMWTLLGPTVGAVFTQVLAETLRVAIQGSATLKGLLGSSALALDQMIYGLLLVLFIIYMPKGILGTGSDWWRRWRG
ncbi:MAG TPA: branched-chain amino acid ABC transporter permease [Hyphomicrobiaceae bacterium]|nr:branched-chain amino acid ABC transporter permease [Hyphomicrobiaceae bacterium]